MAKRNLWNSVEADRVLALGDLNVATQAELGQYFTPLNAAKFIASIPRLPDVGVIKVLDPGAGNGMLSAALVARILDEHKQLNVKIVAIERDEKLIPHLEKTFSACVAAGDGRVNVEVIHADFILDSVGVNASLDFHRKFDIVIENPPYGKLGANSAHRVALRAAGVDTPNLYAAFLALSIEALRDEGQLVAITPRSFFNGPYFADFRRYFLRSVSLDRIHVFDSRASVFSDAGVLQENVIFAATRSQVASTVELSISRDHKDDVHNRVVNYDEVVHPNDANLFIRLPSSPEDSHTANAILLQPCTLTDIGIQVSTGRVVDFRSRHAISEIAATDAAPLIYPGNLKDGHVSWPRAIRKPQYFTPAEPKDEQLLLPEGWYVVVKRFSAKEERRRIVAAVWSPENQPGPVAFENHLNVYHCDGRGMNQDLAMGLANWLNSDVVDKYFRTFSGHTQVNATDLRSLRYPSLETFYRYGVEELESLDELAAA